MSTADNIMDGGGPSGNNAAPPHPEWTGSTADTLRDYCRYHNLSTDGEKNALWARICQHSGRKAKRDPSKRKKPAAQKTGGTIIRLKVPQPQRPQQEEETPSAGGSGSNREATVTPDDNAGANAQNREDSDYQRAPLEVLRMDCEENGLPTDGGRTRLVERLMAHEARQRRQASGSEEQQAAEETEAAAVILQPRPVEWWTEKQKELHTDDSSARAHFNTLSKLGMKDGSSLLDDICNPFRVLNGYSTLNRQGRVRETKNMAQYVHGLFKRLPRADRRYILVHHNFSNDLLKRAVDRATTDAEKDRLFETEVWEPYTRMMNQRNEESKEDNLAETAPTKAWEREQMVAMEVMMEVWEAQKDEYFNVMETAPEGDQAVNRQQYWAAWWLGREEEQRRNDPSGARFRNWNRRRGEACALFPKQWKMAIKKDNKTGSAWNWKTVLNIQLEETRRVVSALIKRRELEGRDFLFYDGKGNVPQKSTFSTRFAEFFGKRFPVRKNPKGNKRYSRRMLRKTVAIIKNRGRPRARDLPNREAAGMGHSSRIHAGINYHNPELDALAYENMRRLENGEDLDAEQQEDEEMRDAAQEDDGEEPEVGSVSSSDDEDDESGSE